MKCNISIFLKIKCHNKFTEAHFENQFDLMEMFTKLRLKTYVKGSTITYLMAGNNKWRLFELSKMPIH